MSEFNLNHWIEDVVQKKVDEAVEKKTQDFINTIQQRIDVLEQHNREVRITFEQNIYEKVNQVLIEKTENLNLKIEEEINKKYKVIQEQFSAFKDKTNDDFQESIMMKLDEKIKSEFEELSATLQAKIKELDQVMPAICQMKNIDSDKNVGQEASEKQIFLENDGDQSDKIQELKKYFKDTFEGKFEVFDEKIDGLQKDCAESIKNFADNAEKGSKTIRETLDGKLTELESQKNKIATLNETMKGFQQQIEVLKIKGEQPVKQAMSSGSGWYTNWRNLYGGLFYSVAELQELCNTLETTYHYNTRADPNYPHSKLSDMMRVKTYLVTETHRFPGHEILVRCRIVNRHLRILFDHYLNYNNTSICEQLLNVIENWGLNRRSYEIKHDLKWVPLKMKQKD